MISAPGTRFPRGGPGASSALKAPAGSPVTSLSRRSRVPSAPINRGANQSKLSPHTFSNLAKDILPLFKDCFVINNPIFYNPMTFPLLSWTVLSLISLIKDILTIFKGRFVFNNPIFYNPMTFPLLSWTVLSLVLIKDILTIFKGRFVFEGHFLLRFLRFYLLLGSCIVS